jgi:hypothetical protein
VARLEAEVSALKTVPSKKKSKARAAPSPQKESGASTPVPSRWNSAIVPDFPKLFEDFKEKQFTLLWRGSHDGLGIREFHSRCDGHANTLTVILDTDGNIFGGFTPVEWESREPNSFLDRNNCWKADPSLKSFLFTLKNPHNVPARAFALKAEKKNEAIKCDSTWGPHFGDIGVSDTFFGSFSWEIGSRYSYTSDTGLDGETFFTGSKKFRVKRLKFSKSRNKPPFHLILLACCPELFMKLISCTNSSLSIDDMAT